MDRDFLLGCSNWMVEGSEDFLMAEESWEICMDRDLTTGSISGFQSLGDLESSIVLKDYLAALMMARVDLDNRDDTLSRSV